MEPNKPAMQRPPCLMPGNCPQTSMSRSLQRAESLFRSTFNPSLKCLFHVPSQDEEEEDLVVAHNLVSRSSARLQRIQQHLLTGSLPGQHRALWRLFEQRSLLLFVHEYTRRVRLAGAFISRMNHLLQHQLHQLHFSHTQAPLSSPLSRIGLVSLSQEFRLHLNHWSVLCSRVHSDRHLRRALVSQTNMLEEMKQTLTLLGLQLSVLMEQYVYGVLSALGQADSDFVPRDVLEDAVAGTDLYNQAVEEHRVQLNASQRGRLLGQEAHKSKFLSSLPKTSRYPSAAVSVRSLVTLLAVHRADRVARQLDLWISEESAGVCRVHSSHTACSWDQTSSLQTYDEPLPTHQLDSPAPANHLPVSLNPSSLRHNEEQAMKTETGRCQTCRTQAGLTAEAARSDPDPSCERRSAPPPRQLDQSSVEPLFQVLVTSADLLEPSDQLVPVQDAAGWRPGPAAAPPQSTNQNREGANQHRTDWRIPAGDAAESPGDPSDEEQRKEEGSGAAAVRGSHSVQWLDAGRSGLLSGLLERYQSHLVAFCSRALWLKLHAAAAGATAGSISLQDDHRSLQTLRSVTGALQTGLFPKEFRTILEDLRLSLLVQSAGAHWDSVACRALGSALKDKCSRNDSSSSAATASHGEGSVMMSQTMEHLLHLLPPLLSALSCWRSNSSGSEAAGPLGPGGVLQSRTVGLLSASVQISTVWVMVKAYQFLSSWSPNRFLLITQGDLTILMESVGKAVQQTKSLLLNPDCAHHPSVWSHSQQLLRQQLEALGRTACELQAFSSLVLNTFSMDCKRMSGEIFERTMPPAVHWRPSQRTGLPSSPSEYASRAAQAVIGQVLEAVAPLSEDARVQALSVTMTAFMEAWMEHILKQKIKFSVQGALQLKEDFDSVREMIQSEEYGLSAELHQRLLGLSVFQQVDSALLCLLQQPQAKPYLQRRTWEPFTHCCPVKGSRDSMDAAVGANITNLGCVEGEELTPSDPSPLTSVLPSGDTSSPAGPYLASSPAVGAVHQEWLDLRINSGARRWRLPGLHCLSQTEP